MRGCRCVSRGIFGACWLVSWSVLEIYPLDVTCKYRADFVVIAFFVFFLRRCVLRRGTEYVLVSRLFLHDEDGGGGRLLIHVLCWVVCE